MGITELEESLQKITDQNTMLPENVQINSPKNSSNSKISDNELNGSFCDNSMAYYGDINKENLQSMLEEKVNQLGDKSNISLTTFDNSNVSDDGNCSIAEQFQLKLQEINSNLSFRQTMRKSPKVLSKYSTTPPHLYVSKNFEMTKLMKEKEKRSLCEQEISRLQTKI